ncbi:hypothetical protein [Bradyrhizobium sp. MOS002]|uniref:hypothetical protein n=1 Tax=Bradyrhizobium sp. MOS002 TaxID=2133947 RepID=UPI0018EDF592|nr:hypothetical protein [Bradyrhizobium sp. MOS002]
MLRSFIPEGIEALAPKPLLLPGERAEEYQLLQQAILDELEPSSAIEWLLTLDVAELCWEIQRYRLLRYKTLELFREQAIEHALNHIDVAGLPSEMREGAKLHTRRNAIKWRTDPIAAREIEARLSAHGFDQHSISAAMYAHARELFLMFEGLIASAQQRRLMLLKSLEARRQHTLVQPPSSSTQRKTMASEENGKNDITSGDHAATTPAKTRATRDRSRHLAWHIDDVEHHTTHKPDEPLDCIPSIRSTKD